MKKMVFIILAGIILSGCGGNAENLSVGSEAPNFTLQDADNNSYTLSDFESKSPVVIYFYPKANTSGCTKQACGIRDDYSKFKENGIEVFGISVDSKESIKEFINDNQLNFPLLSDIDKKVAEAYGVLNNVGVASRVTFIVDKKGNLANIIRDVDVYQHAGQVLALTQKLL